MPEGLSGGTIALPGGIVGPGSPLKIASVTKHGRVGGEGRAD